MGDYGKKHFRYLQMSAFMVRTLNRPYVKTLLNDQCGKL